MGGPVWHRMFEHMQIYAANAYAAVACANMHRVHVLLGSFWCQRVRSGLKRPGPGGSKGTSHTSKGAMMFDQSLWVCQLIREEHSVSGHMCTGEPVSQHAAGKHGGGTPLTSQRRSATVACCGLGAPSPWHHLLRPCLERPGGASQTPTLRNLSSLQNRTQSEPRLCVWFLLSRT